RAPRHIAIAHHANPLAFEQGLGDVAVDRHTAHILDLATSDGLTVGDQRQGLQQRTGIALRALLPEPANPGGETLTHLQAITRGDFLEFEGTALAGLAQNFQRHPELLGLGPLALLEKLEETLKRLRLAGGEQEGFEQLGQFFGVVQIHSARARTWMAAKGSFCTSSTRDSLLSSRTAMKVTTTPSRPSSTAKSSTNGTNAPPLRRSSTSLMRSRVDRASRVTWWLSNMSARRSTSAIDNSTSSRLTSGSSLRARASGASSLGTVTSR